MEGDLRPAFDATVHTWRVSDRAVSILERPVYGIAEAAGLLGLRTDRVRAWLDGYERAGRKYEPVIRAEPTGEDVVTWGEFVELGYLREYRRNRVSMQYLRPVVDVLREEFQTPYPLATTRPFIYDRELVLKAQQAVGLPASIGIVIRSGQEIMMTPETNRFFKKVEFDPRGEARLLRPAGPTSPVVIDPLVRFGQPSVAGVATERLWELYDAGEDLDEIANVYELDPHAVRSAVAFEEQFRSLAA